MLPQALLNAMLLLCCGLGAASVVPPGGSSATDAVTIDLAATPVVKEFFKFWQASVGSGHAALGVPGAIPAGAIPVGAAGSLGKMWQEQLKAVHDDCGINGVRFHGSFDDDMGPVATGCDAVTGRHCTWNFTGLDVLYDGILAANVKPIVELSFMPTSMANCTAGHCPTGMHYRGVEAHPKSFEAWGDLVGAFAKHLVDRVRRVLIRCTQSRRDLCSLPGVGLCRLLVRDLLMRVRARASVLVQHGLDEIVQWRFEVWNEMCAHSFSGVLHPRPEFGTAVWLWCSPCPLGAGGVWSSVTAAWTAHTWRSVRRLFHTCCSVHDDPSSQSRRTIAAHSQTTHLIMPSRRSVLC